MKKNKDVEPRRSQIATTVLAHLSGVLGLAPRHCSKPEIESQVRPVGQTGYPISLVASLDTVPVKCCVPLLINRNRSFTSIQTFHTHALQLVGKQLWPGP